MNVKIQKSYLDKTFIFLRPYWPYFHLHTAHYSHEGQMRNIIILKKNLSVILIFLLFKLVWFQKTFNLDLKENPCCSVQSG